MSGFPGLFSSVIFLGKIGVFAFKCGNLLMGHMLTFSRVGVLLNILLNYINIRNLFCVY